MTSLTPTCTECQKPFKITEDEAAFINKISPQIGGAKLQIPLPENCPGCRLRARMVHRNEDKFHSAKSFVSGKPLISLYDNDSPYKICAHEEWWNDTWDAADYGQDFDFSRSFFEQFHDLDLKIPRVSVVQLNNENSPYSSGTAYCKNCYLINCSENSEDCYYGKLIQNSRNIVDSDYVYDSELLYGCFNVTNCYSSKYLLYSQNCQDCYFSDNLRGCRNCFLCCNLVNKEFCFMNEQLSKEAYEQKVKEFLGAKSRVENAKKLLTQMRRKRIHKAANVVNCENSTGDFLSNCQNCQDCYETNDSQDCRYVVVGVNIKDVYDCNNMYLKPELNYQVMATIGTYNVIFSLYIFNSQEVMYSAFCFNSKNLFGCVGLRNKQYCIFNKQYTKEEYEALVPRLIQHMQAWGEWGKFIPAKYVEFPYNDTVAHDYLPLSKEQALGKGYKWKDLDPREFKPQTYPVPDEINSVNDEILQQVLACESCKKNYRIIPQELKQIKTMNLAIPHHCPDCRHQERMTFKNPRTLWERACMKCSLPMHSTFSPDRPEHVYCEKCYLQAIY